MCNEDYRVVSIDKAKDIIHEIETDPHEIESVCSDEAFVRLVADWGCRGWGEESKLAEMYQYIHDDAVTTFNERWTEVEVEE